MVTLVARCSCSNRQCESQPSRFVRFPSSHCSPAERLPSPQTMLWQSLSQVVPFGGSHCSPVSTVPLPHRFGTHAALRQTFPVSQEVPLASGVRVEQVCAASSQIDPPWQGSAGAQLRLASVETQLKWQVELQPCVPSLTPSSHSSGAVTMPSPQTGAWHAPSRQIFASPHDAPAASAPLTVQRKSLPHEPLPL